MSGNSGLSSHSVGSLTASGSSNGTKLSTGGAHDPALGTVGKTVSSKGLKCKDPCSSTLNGGRTT